MIKKTIPYNDLDGNPKTEDFWFQLTQADFIKKALTEGGEAYLEKLKKLTNLTEADIENGIGKQVMDVFETLLGDAVGRREDDLFIKDESITRRFMFSGAYDAFFLELLNSPDSGATFMRGIFPTDAQMAIDKALLEARNVEGEVVAGSEVVTEEPVLQAAAPQLEESGKDDEPKWLKEGRYATQKELLGMSQDELTLAMKMKNSKAFG